MTTTTDRQTTSHHTLSTSCWCQPASAWDGHRAEAGDPVDFEAMAGDPVDAAGFPLEVPR